MPDLLQIILPSRAVLFLSAALYYYAAFSFSRRILRGPRAPAAWELATFAGFNSALLVFFSFSLDVPASMVAMTMIPLLVVLELLLVSRDGWWTCLNLYFSGALNLLCSHSIAGAIVNMLIVDRWPAGSAEHRYILFSVTVLVAAATYTGLIFSRITPISVLSELMHSRSRGMLLFAYFLVTDAVLLISSQSRQVLVYDDTMDWAIRMAMHQDTALKDGLILGCSFLIIMVQIWQEQQIHRGEELEQQLQTERDFRASSRSDSLLHFCANLSRDTVLEGREVFPFLNEDGSGYSGAIRQFAAVCVHPEDLSVLLVANDISYYTEKLASDPNYAMRVRISPARLLETADSWHMWGGDLTLEQEWIWVEFRVTLVREKGTEDILAYVALDSVDKDVREQDALRRMANTDALTGLLNRAAIREILQQHVGADGAAGTLFLIDMDHFKEVNDTLGHPAGDALLRETAAMFRAVFRDGDFVGRLGGDEFCIFAPGLRNPERIRALAEALNRQGRRVHPGKDGEPFRTTLSIGVAVCPDHGDTGEKLYAAADLALYRAKEAGRDTFRICPPDTPPSEHEAISLT